MCRYHKENQILDQSKNAGIKIRMLGGTSQLSGQQNEFCHAVYNQYESFIYLDIMVKNREVPIEIYFK
jgi:hypothetical protein